MFNRFNKEQPQADGQNLDSSQDTPVYRVIAGKRCQRVESDISPDGYAWKPIDVEPAMPTHLETQETFATADDVMDPQAELLRLDQTEQEMLMAVKERREALHEEMRARELRLQEEQEQLARKRRQEMLEMALGANRQNGTRTATSAASAQRENRDTFTRADQVKLQEQLRSQSDRAVPQAPQTSELPIFEAQALPRKPVVPPAFGADHLPTEFLPKSLKKKSNHEHKNRLSGKTVKLGGGALAAVVLSGVGWVSLNEENVSAQQEIIGECFTDNLQADPLLSGTLDVRADAIFGYSQGQAEDRVVAEFPPRIASANAKKRHPNFDVKQAEFDIVVCETDQGGSAVELTGDKVIIDTEKLSVQAMIRKASNVEWEAYSVDTLAELTSKGVFQPAVATNLRMTMVSEESRLSAADITLMQVAQQIEDGKSKHKDSDKKERSTSAVINAEVTQEFTSIVEANVAKMYPDQPREVVIVGDKLPATDFIVSAEAPTSVVEFANDTQVRLDKARVLRVNFNEIATE